MAEVLKKFETKNIKITVEEIGPFKFIATLWDKNHSLENDREVLEFETFGGAMDTGFDLLSNYAEHFLKARQ